MSVQKSRSSVLWLQVWGLATVQAAITLAWVVYGAYLPGLLSQFGFAQELAATLLVVESALAVLMEPLMGGLSDRAQEWVGTRFPFIAAGVVLSSALFITIPTLAIFGSNSALGRSLLLVVLIAWALAMTIFRSPATSLLRKYTGAATADLPRATSLLTLAGGLVSAFRPLAGRYILSLGPAIAFAIGSFVLLAATAVLRFFDMKAIAPASLATPLQTPAQNPDALQSDPDLGRQSHYQAITLLAMIAVLGATVGLGLRAVTGEVLPRILLRAEIPFGNLDLWLGLFALTLALFALPAGAIASKYGNERVLMASFIALIICLIPLSFNSGAIAVVILAILLAAGLSTASNSAVSLALSCRPESGAGLAIGTYFGGFSGAIALFSTVFPKPEQLSLLAVLIVGAIAFLSAAMISKLATASSSPES